MNLINYKKYLVITLSCIATLLLGLGMFIYVIDPNQIYHQHNTYAGNQRYEIAGIAKNHDYNAIILGSSMCMNHFPEQIDSLFGYKTKNFSMMGITHDEYDILLPYIIKQGKAKNIIFGLDIFSFISELGAIPPELYDENPWNDVIYLLGYSGVEHAIKYLKNPLVEKNLYHFESPLDKETVLNEFEALKKAEIRIYDYDQIIKNFDEHVFAHLASGSKDIKWQIYFPPYNIAEFAGMQFQNQLESALKAKKYIIKKLSKLPNVELFDFQCDPWITNMDEYMDSRHHSHNYNKKIIESIKNKKFLVQKDSIDFNNNYLIKLSNEFIKKN